MRELGQAKYIKTKYITNKESRESDLTILVNDWLYENEDLTILDIKFSGDAVLIIYADEKINFSEFYKNEVSG